MKNYQIEPPEQKGLKPTDPPPPRKAKKIIKSNKTFKQKYILYEETSHQLC